VYNIPPKIGPMRAPRFKNKSTIADWVSKRRPSSSGFTPFIILYSS
jgi:hypothetical protein